MSFQNRFLSMRKEKIHRRLFKDAPDSIPAKRVVTNARTLRLFKLRAKGKKV